MKKYYGFKNYPDIPDWFKDIIYKLGWRRLPNTAKPEYIDLVNGRLAYVTKDRKLKERKPGYNKGGYSTTKLKMTDGSFKSFRLNQLILLFIKNTDSKPYAHHKNHDKKDNRIDNIAPATPKENANW